MTVSGAEGHTSYVAPVILRGETALSRFRIEPLLKAVAEESADLGVTDISTEYVYFIETRDQIDDATRDKCFSLLEANEILSELNSGFVVMPRIGTISPWSSKATDIFRNCGLAAIMRVERGIRYTIECGDKVLSLADAASIVHLFYDRMTEGVYDDVSHMFAEMEPRPVVAVDIISQGKASLEAANAEMGLALSQGEIDYLYDCYSAIERNPTDAELVMFGQVNSEHCRHKIFNADWIIDGEQKDMTLFNMIRNTHKSHPAGTLVAYEDNASVIEGFHTEWFESSPSDGERYSAAETDADIVMKVETHNHPTAISPYAGAATGIGGEIRDEVATGVGGKTRAGMAGFMVSNLRIPGFAMPWEKDYAEFPRRLASPLEIMLEGPIGGAGFGNEFGRPQLCGFFKTYEEEHNGRYRGYHKPIMIAGGMGVIKRRHTQKHPIPVGAHIIQLGGPAMRIGLGGGAASSMDTGSNEEQLDFDSVQRGNPEMQRRCQQVVDACIAMNDDNPICSVHDLGAGGLSNGCPELVSETGAKFWLRKVHNEEPSMSPMEIWCCEAQERYVMAVEPAGLDAFLAACERERCKVAVIGETTGDGHLTLYDEHFDNNPIDIELQVILGKPPKMLRDVSHKTEEHAPVDLSGIDIADAAVRVLQLPSVAKKTFLISIADRTVLGMTARDQMAGPYQEPISDFAVTALSFTDYGGSAMSTGERTAIALVSAPAAGRMAVGEAVTNICGAYIGEIGNIKLSANWMCACGEEGEDANLYDTVQAVGMEFCPRAHLSIPVGKDSLSMRTVWESSDGTAERQVAPLSLVISAFAPVQDVRKTVSADLKRGTASQLVLIDLGHGKNRMGCSALSRVFNQVGSDPADADDPEELVRYVAAVQELISKDLLLAYHDRSDGGMFVTAAEMAFGGRLGVELTIDGSGEEAISALFNEELGALVQVADTNADAVLAILSEHGLANISCTVGRVTEEPVLKVIASGDTIYSERVSSLNRVWSEMTYRMQSLRDNPACVEQEFEAVSDEKDPGITFGVTYDMGESLPQVLLSGAKPRVAILREQGVNGHIEMAAAFAAAGFESVDVHMTDLHRNRVDLGGFAGLVACGGFSYGDVLGAGSGWAKSILFKDELKDQFAAFFARPETFALGVCNGCQMISQLKDIIPGAENWPEFVRNSCEQFEARYVTVEILDSPSIFLKDMQGARVGIPVAHGEGRVSFANTGSSAAVESERLAAVRYVDNYGAPTERYPLNPNGSPGGLTGVTTVDGRVTIMMPHPERGFRSLQLSYAPPEIIGEAGPWLRMFQNARKYIG